MLRSLIVAAAIVLVAVGQTFAAHPLITDDTGTQGKGKFQLEIIGEYQHESKDGITIDSVVVPTIPVLSYGITDTSDIVLGISYQHVRTSDSQKTTTADGLSDTSVELKWRFYDKDGLSFALKPGISIPTGNDEKGFGAGKITYHLFLIATKEIKPWAFHLNLGYIRNENKINERNDIWHSSLAGEVEFIKNLKAVANVGIERDRDKASNTIPAFILGGLIYSISTNLDIDIGIKKGINNRGNDYSIPAGITWRF
ncbi:MAG: transporter [Thermodesulfovibrionales bacterium]